MKSSPLVAAGLLALSLVTRAEVIGVEQFDYPDGTVASQAGGIFWDWKNTAPTSHTGTASTWDNAAGVPAAVAGRLVTDNSAIKREFNGASEAEGAVNDGNVSKAVYFRITLTTGATLPASFGLSSDDFGAERAFIGKPAGENVFGIVLKDPFNTTSLSATPVEPNTTYTLVAKISFPGDQVALFLNPDLNAPEPVPVLSVAYTGTNWSTAVRLASGSGGTVAWDDLVVATTWNELGTVVTTAADEDDGSLGGGTGISLREAYRHSPSGSLITFAPELDGKAVALSLGQIGASQPGSYIIDASSLPRGLTVDGNRSSGLFLCDVNTALTLKSLMLTRGNGQGAYGNLGGALYNRGKLHVNRCTFSDNTANDGGAMWQDGNPASSRFDHCTFAGNRSAAGFTGGGIVTIGGSMTLRHCTIAGNTGNGSGGGLYLQNPASVTVENCIIAGNRDLAANDIYRGSGTLVAAGTNLIGSNSTVAATFPAGPLVGTQGLPLDPKLSDLAQFGGPTLTMHPLIGSPVIDAGTTTSPGGTDQRGSSRFADGDGNNTAALDPGAVESWPRTRSLLVPHHPVTTATDEDDGSILALGTGTSLREAILYGASGSVITFAPGMAGQTVTLGLGEVAIGKDFFIDASNLSAPVTISGNHASRLFHVAAGSSLAVQNLALTQGRAPNGGTFENGHPGGAILNAGNLSVLDSTLSGNTAGTSGTAADQGGDGGALWNSGSLVVSSSSFSGNAGGAAGFAADRGGAGGAIWNSGTMLVSTTTFSGNTGSQSGDFGGDGGAIWNSDRAVISDSIFSGNTAGGTGYVFGASGNGGGIFTSGTLILSSSTLSGNAAGSGGEYGGSGGGISNSGTLIANSSTLSGNTAGGAGYTLGVSGHGGGISNSGTLVLTSSTLSGNTAGSGGEFGGNGGGISNSGSGTVRLSSSTVHGNAVGTNSYVFGFPGNGGGISFTGTGFQLDNTIVTGNTPDNLTGTAPTGAGNLTAGDAMLAPLGDYGGPTRTLLPLPGSPAINGSVGSAPATDQRGLARNGTADIGAVETQAALAGFTDDDSDGMDDRREVLYGFVVGVQDGQLDADGDGSSNADELGNMTGPRDPASLFKILNFQRLDSSTVTVTWTSFPGLSYGFDFSFGDLGLTGTGTFGSSTGMTTTSPLTGAPGTFDLPSFFLRIRRD